MAAIPGIRFDLSGASGSQGLLSPKSLWRTYVFPRGGFASQDSTGTLITFDSAAIASRFAVNQWIQSGLNTANIRKVSAVGGNSISVSGAAVTVAENDRIFLIGNTQPTVTGGSATYLIPQSIIRQRDDDGSDLYTNSMVTSNADGLIQFFSEPAVYDCIIQDGNQANQGSIIDLAVGVAEGISTSFHSIFGATVTVNAAFGVTGWATFGQTVTMNAAMGVTGWATFGSSVTMNSTLGVTGVATFSGRAAFGNSVSIDGAIGVTGWATFGSTITANAALGVTGTAVFGTTATFSGNVRLLGVTLTNQVAGETFSRATMDRNGSWYFGDGSVTPGRWGIVDAFQLIAGNTATFTLDNINNHDIFKGFNASGSTTLVSTPTIANGSYSGQRILLMNLDATDTITIQDITGLSGTGLRLGAASRALGPRDSIELLWIGAATNEWMEIRFNNLV